jgi:4-hydroxythreonine-4-phosphate dehydrogenase
LLGTPNIWQQQFDAKEHLMFLVSDDLKIGTVTGHIPINQVATQLSIEKIISKAKLMASSLQNDFGIRKPRIAVLGLNPHAGDNGVIGDEEKNIIIPAIEKLKEQGILAFGPFGADGFFGSGVFTKYDAALSMYHDQGLIPFKTMAFDNGVNYTAGLSIVRTSPDHGTAYDLAGKNKASESSFRYAVYAAIDILFQRKLQAEIAVNPLKISMQKRERDR